MNAMPSRRAPINGAALITFSLVCAALMILAALGKRGLPVGSFLHEALEWSILFLICLVIIGTSVFAVPLRHRLRGGVQR